MPMPMPAGRQTTSYESKNLRSRIRTGDGYSRSSVRPFVSRGKHVADVIFVLRDSKHPFCQESGLPTLRLQHHLNSHLAVAQMRSTYLPTSFAKTRLSAQYLRGMYVSDGESAGTCMYLCRYFRRGGWRAGRDLPTLPQCPHGACLPAGTVPENFSLEGLFDSHAVPAKISVASGDEGGRRR